MQTRLEKKSLKNLAKSQKRQKNFIKFSSAGDIKMISLDKYFISWLLEKAPQRKNVSAWNKGVKNYAIYLIDDLSADYCLIFDNQAELEEQLKFFKKLLLNGAENWRQYSYCGNAYIYDGDIAVALCSPSEYRKTKGGEKKPNNRETWLDVQARALFQAEILIKSTIRDFADQYFKRYNKQ